MLAAAEVGAQHAQAPDERRHFGSSERKQLGAVHQVVLRGHRQLALHVVAEAIGIGLQHRERLHVGLVLPGVRAARCKGHRNLHPGISGGFLHAGRAREHDQVGEGDLLASILRGVELLLNGLEGRQHLREDCRLVHLPILLGGQPYAGSIGAAALIGPAEGGCGRPRRRDQLGNREAGGEHLCLERGDVLLINERVIHRGQRVLPDQLLGGHFGTQVARAGAPVAVRQLEPCASECLREGLRVLQEAARDLAELRIEAEREIGGKHGRLVELARNVRIRDDLRGVLGHPLLGSRGRLGQLPLVFVEVLQEVVAPERRSFGPGNLEAAGDGIRPMPRSVVADPAKALRLQRRALRIRSHMGGRRGAVAFAEGVAAGDEGYRLLIVHRHSAEGRPDILGGGHEIAAGVRPFRVHVDKPHVRGAEGPQVPIAAEAPIVAQPLNLLAPVHVLVRLPHILAARAEAEGLEAHGFQRDVAGENQEVRPGDLLAVLLLNGPEQAARLVKVGIVRPTVEGSEALLAAPGTAPAIGYAIGARRMPGHADEERSVVAEVGGPPVL